MGYLISKVTEMKRKMLIMEGKILSDAQGWEGKKKEGR
jgi:hypothetical protein